MTEYIYIHVHNFFFFSNESNNNRYRKGNVHLMSSSVSCGENKIIIPARAVSISEYPGEFETGTCITLFYFNRQTYLTVFAFEPKGRGGGGMKKKKKKVERGFRII